MELKSTPRGSRGVALGLSCPVQSSCRLLLRDLMIDVCDRQPSCACCVYSLWRNLPTWMVFDEMVALSLIHACVMWQLIVVRLVVRVTSWSQNMPKAYEIVSINLRRPVRVTSWPSAENTSEAGCLWSSEMALRRGRVLCRTSTEGVEASWCTVHGLQAGHGERVS